MPKTSNEELLTIPEVALRLRLTEATLRLGRNITRFRWEIVQKVMEERAAGRK
jgi:hypothetical protein